MRKIPKNYGKKREQKKKNIEPIRSTLTKETSVALLCQWRQARERIYRENVERKSVGRGGEGGLTVLQWVMHAIGMDL